MAFELPALPYDFGALEPHIDARTMEIHHDKHHAGYVNNANIALAGSEWADAGPCKILPDLASLPDSIRTAVRNNVGGHVNHSLFWSIMGPGCGGEPTGDLAEAITRDFGSFDGFKEAFAKAATTRFGSGWAWLGVKDASSGSLCVCSTPNQDNPLMRGMVDCECHPILGLDVWEHAYYLNYQNRRPDYVSAFWNVVNWAAVAEHFAKVTSGGGHYGCGG
ncbi:MAG: superoxide dismutase [Planctomycetes bacterium]|nr:superoxide dismutase [Planctomycetota bacterium]NOG55596.1 superoxide dismutase [Planctomycetota bacterium]